MTPTKTHKLGASTGLVLLVFSVLVLLACPIGARASGPEATKGDPDPQVVASVPASHPIGKRHIAVRVTCMPSEADDFAWRGDLTLNYFERTGKPIKVPPFARVPVIPRWVPAGESTVYHGRVARSPGIKRALRQGPVTMRITVEVKTVMGSRATQILPVRLTR